MAGIIVADGVYRKIVNRNESISKVQNVKTNDLKLIENHTKPSNKMKLFVS